MRRIYVAGPYNADNVIDVLNNMRRGIRISVELLTQGFAPFCPWLDYNFQLQAELTIKQFKDFSMAWVQVSDAIFMITGWENSKGAIAEKEEAERLGIPVFYDLDSLLAWGKPKICHDCSDSTNLRECDKGRWLDENTLCYCNLIHQAVSKEDFCSSWRSNDKTNAHDI